MTIDDAIVAFEQVVSGDYDSLELDVRDYERLVKWLTELKLARENAFSDIGLAARAVSENHQLNAENAKLRELVSELHYTLRDSAGEPDVCEHCNMWGTCSDNGWKECEFDRQMHELGIEA